MCALVEFKECSPNPTPHRPKTKTRRTSYGKTPVADSSKARRELGLEFLPLQETVVDMALGMQAKGIVKLPGVAA